MVIRDKNKNVHIINSKEDAIEFLKETVGDEVEYLIEEFISNEYELEELESSLECAEQTLDDYKSALNEIYELTDHEEILNIIREVL